MSEFRGFINQDFNISYWLLHFAVNPPILLFF